MTEIKKNVILIFEQAMNEYVKYEKEYDNYVKKNGCQDAKNEYGEKLTPKQFFKKHGITQI